jgi:hypothetical protein
MRKTPAIESFVTAADGGLSRLPRLIGTNRIHDTVTAVNRKIGG